MAELAVATTVGLLQIVIPLLRDNLDNGAKAGPKCKIDSIGSWLEYLKAFIKDNEGREGGADEQLKDDIKKVRKIAHDIEDVLDEFLLHSQPYRYHKYTIIRKIRNSAHQVKHQFLLRYSISDKIENIMTQIDGIKIRRKAFPEGSSSSGPSHRVSPLLLDREMVGYEDEKAQFVRLLVNGGEGLVRAAVVGPAGSGKTTFVKNIFWERGIMAKFDCRAWIHLGRRFDSGELSRNLLKQLGLWKISYPLDDADADADADAGLSILRNYLSRKRYLVILDDAWGEIDWDYIWKAFPDAFYGSRIIVTTRSSNVASVITSSPDKHTFKLNGLQWSQGWDLFCRKAFSDNNNECPAELKDLSKNIVTRCERIPLVIVAVAGALARKPKLPNEWEKFHQSLDIKSLKVINNALLPDYTELSSNLKSCFLYFSIFPEDYSVQRGRLIRLWVAEGFAVETGSSTAEEIAGDYLNELIDRNLVDVSDWDFNGQPRNCRVLNFVLKFIIQKCEDENFASIFNKENTCQSRSIRRLSVQQDHPDLLPPSNFGGVRSIFLTRPFKTQTSDFNQNLREMKLLKVFDFQAAPLTEFPKGITDFILIKYLSFRGMQIKTIPSNIKKLSYLETLDPKETEVTKLPQEISHLHKLRHLLAYKYLAPKSIPFNSVRGAEIHNGIGNLTNLQHLSLVKLGKNDKILQDLKKLKKLRKLGVMGIKTGHGKDLRAAVEEMHDLRTLDVCAATMNDYLELGLATDRAPKKLERLYLKGKLKEFPVWISSLSNLLKIALKCSKLQDSPVEGLGKLANLLQLQLVECYEGEELVFKASTFEKLKILAIEGLVNLHTIVIQNRALLNVTEVSLLKCRRLKICPLGIGNLKKVEKLNLYDMDEELIGRIGKRGEDHAMVQHIPVVNCFNLNLQRGQV